MSDLTGPRYETLTYRSRNERVTARLKTFIQFQVFFLQVVWIEQINVLELLSVSQQSLAVQYSLLADQSTTL